MKKTPLFRYYWLGTCIRYLQDAQAGFRIHGDEFIIANIDAFLKYLDEPGLSVTGRTEAVRKLKNFRDDISKAEGGENATLSAEQAGALQALMKEARTTLDAEITGYSVYFVSPKRIDVNKLLEDVSGLFPPDTYEKMPKIAQYDFSEAGRCIAFERPTAAAFHMLRGSEAVLRNFYCTLIRQKRVPPLLWGPIVEDMRKRSRTKGYKTLYNNLDNIRVSYRNPTQHPEAIYDIHEAQDLWGLCTEVVNRMVKVLGTA